MNYIIAALFFLYYCLVLAKCIFYIDPDFLFLDEDWPKSKPLSVSICADSVDYISILSGNDKHRFALVPLNSTCGTLRLEKDLDADMLHSDGTRWQSFSLLFEDTQNHERASLDIQVVDVNDIVPAFMNVPAEIKASEKLAVGSVIQTIKAFDPDTGVGGVVKFFIDGLKFAVANEKCSNSECSADLVLKLPLDYESNPVEHVKIIARDGASLTKHSNERSTNLTINLIDEQDMPPNFVTILGQPLRVSESLPVGSKVFQSNAEDGDRYAQKKNEIHYEISKNAFFDIDPFSGWIFLKNPLDREKNDTILLSIIATEQDAQRMSSEVSMKIQVEDADDNKPRCSANQYLAKLDRAARKFDVETPITVLDMDLGKNAQFDVSLAGEFSDSFKVLPSKIQGNADLILKVADFDSLEYVADKEFLLELKLTPRNDETKGIGKCVVVVSVDGDPKKKISHHSFKFTKKHYNLKLKENIAPMILVNLTDTSHKDAIFSLEGDGAQYFAVNNSQLISVKPVDAEKYRKIHLKISGEKNENDMANDRVVSSTEVDIEMYVYDQGAKVGQRGQDGLGQALYSCPFLSCPVHDPTLCLRLNSKLGYIRLDENDNSPVFDKPFYQFNVTEETEAIFHVRATDRDVGKNAQLTYTIVSGKVDGISINSNDGRIFVSKIDAEHSDWLVKNLTVEAADNGSPPLKNSTIVRIVVQDINDNAPFFSRNTYNAILNCTLPIINSTVMIVKAIDLDATGSKIVVYELSGEMAKYFKIGRTSGHIRLANELPKNKDVFYFNVIATDSGDPPKQSIARVSLSKEGCSTSASTSTTTTKNVGESLEKDKSKIYSVRHYHADVDENSSIGTIVLQIDSNSTHLLKDAKLNLVMKNSAEKFLQLNPAGQVVVAHNIDYEQTNLINGSIFARSGKRNLLIATITVTVNDIDDNSPVFRLPSAYKIYLPSNISVGYILDLPYPLAEDYDGTEIFSQLEYEVVNRSEGLFTIDRNTSIIQLVKPLNSSIKKLNLTIRASETYNASNYVDTQILIDFAPQSKQINQSATVIELLEKLTSEFNVFEDEPLGSTVLFLNLSQDNNNKTIADTELALKNSEFFEMNGPNITLKKSFRGHANEKHCVQLEVRYQGKTTAKNLCFYIKARTKGPIVYWPSTKAVLKFKENIKYETLATINASSSLLDPKHNKLKYGLMELKNGDWKEFSIDSQGVLRSKQPFDFERKDRYSLQVQVCDFADQCVLVSFEIDVEDLNDMCPVFINKIEEFTIAENQAVDSKGILVGKFEKAVDNDGTVEKRSICYKVDDNNSPYFIPNPQMPHLYVKTSLDREAQSAYNVSVRTYDCHLKESNLSCQDTIQNNTDSIKIVRIVVTDVNDNFPKFLEKEYYGKILERRTQFDDVILQTLAIDPDDEKSGLQYSISSVIRTDKETISKEDAPFFLNSTTGEIISKVVYSTDMPYSYNFRVAVRDEVGHEDEATVTITVLNYIEQMELVFNMDENSIKSNVHEITKLMFEATTLYFVPDNIRGHSNSTTMIGHFLELDKHLAPANKALVLFEETQSEQAQKARNTLKRRYALHEIVSNTSIQDLAESNTFLLWNMDLVMLIVTCVFCVLFLIFLLLLFYLCCHRRSKLGKMNGFSGTTRTTRSLIFADTPLSASKPKSFAHHKISSPRLISHEELPINKTVKLFQTLQSTEL